MVYSGIHEAEDSFFYNKKNYKPPTITKLLFEREDIIVSRQGVARVLTKKQVQLAGAVG